VGGVNSPLPLEIQQCCRDNLTKEIPRGKDNGHMQVIGFCRFSYPAEGGFQVGHDTIEDRMAYLYAPARMEERFRVFEAITLPSLRAQTDPDFTFLVLIGDSLPPEYLDRLTSLLSDFPQARIVARPPLPHRDVCKAVINDVRKEHPGPCLQFRHDDDDAVSVTFVARLREAAADSAGLVARHRLVAFDFNRGHVARPSKRGIEAVESFNPYWGVALGMAVQAEARLTIMNFGHYKLPQFMPTVTYTDTPMFVRGHNDHNDSRQGLKVKQEKLTLLDATGEALFRATYNIDSDAVRRIFSAPKA
jgi:hypothetical protein